MSERVAEVLIYQLRDGRWSARLGTGERLDIYTDPRDLFAALERRVVGERAGHLDFDASSMVRRGNAVFWRKA